ncbi:MAG: flagellar hook-associated protein FlgL [Thermosulfidibacteraceae bacterium]
MRISTNLFFTSIMKNYETTTGELVTNSRKISSGKRYTRISESPSDMSKILSLNRDISTVDSFLENMNLAKNWLSTIDSVFSKVEDFVQRVRELAIQGANDSQNRDTRNDMGKEIFGILDELVDSANTKSGDRYLFGGTKLDDAPFANPPNNALTIKSPPIEGLNVITSEPFFDLSQLPTGNYRIFLRREHDYIRIFMVDENGRKIQIDSNGSDDSNNGGNLLSDFGVMNFSDINNKLYGVFDTGRGLKISIDGVSRDLLDKGVYVDLFYTNGGEVSYSGTNRVQPVKIGYMESVPVTVAGEDVFMASKRLLTSQARIDGISEATTFSSLGIGDGSKYVIDGTDHFGYPVGSATVVGKKPVSLVGPGTYTLKFYINKEGNLLTDTLTFTVTDVSKGVESFLDAIKDAIEGSSILRNEIEVVSEGSNLAFHLLDPSESYLWVEESGSDSLGFSGGIGSWGSSPIYTVKDKICGKGVVFNNPTSIKINVPGSSYTINIGPTAGNPVYSVMPVNMRLYDKITAGTTISVSDGVINYTWVAPFDISTVDDFVKAWDDDANWGSVPPPVGVVKEGSGQIRFVGLNNTNSYTFSSTGNALYKVGLVADPTSNTFVLDSGGDYREFSALRIAYYINKGTNYNLKAYTNGFGEFSIENVTGSFNIEMDPTSPMKEAFATYYDNGVYRALSDNDTLLDFIRAVEDLYRSNVRGYIYDGRLWFEDNKGGISKFTIGISPFRSERSIFDRFFVAREGQGVDLFTVVKNIAKTLSEGMTKRGVDLPSDWYSVERGDSIYTSIFKAFSGNFTGNYSTIWNVKVNLVDSTGNVLQDGYVGNFDGVNYKLLVTITDSDGKNVAQFLADKPGAYYYVRDGVYITLGDGVVKSGDSFRIQVSGGIQDLVGHLDKGLQRVLSGHTNVGAKLKEIEFADSRYTVKNTDLTKEKANLEEVDLAKAITDLQKSQLALQATLQTIVRLTNLSILDFLR